MRTNALKTDEWALLERLLMPANALIVRCMLETGLRVSDVVRLRSYQVQNCSFTVCECKTLKQRDVTISEELRAAMAAQAGALYVFEGAGGACRHRTRQAVWADIKRASKAMRIDLNIAPHSARKTYAVELYRRTGDINIVREALNHDNIAVTVLYLLDLFKQQR